MFALLGCFGIGANRWPECERVRRFPGVNETWKHFGADLVLCLLGSSCGITCVKPCVQEVALTMT